MKPLELKTKIAEVLAERFLKELERTTPAKKEFVDAIRPAIMRLFKELPEEKQALLMYLLKQSVSETPSENQLDIRTLMSDKEVPLDHIDRENLEKVKRQIQYIHGVVASTVLVSYGGLGEEYIAVEG